MNILQKPDLIIYFIGVESSKKEVMEWMNLLSCDNSHRVVFFSDARTYHQRQQILEKLAPLFLTDILEHIYFPNIDPASITTCLCNLGEVGLTLQFYTRTISKTSQVKWALKKLCSYLRRREEESVI